MSPATARERPPGLGRAEILIALASVAAVAVLLASVELGLRAAGIGDPTTTLGPLHVYSEIYGWQPRPGVRMVDDGHVTTINAKGYRGPELPPQKSGRKRVVLLGDSVSFGLEVGDAEPFADVLRARRPDIEIANLSVQGYDPGQELIKLQREGLSLGPDIVVLALCLSNDFADVALPVFLYDGRHPKPYFSVENGRLERHDEQLQLGVRDRLALFLLENSRSYGLLVKALSDRDGAGQHWAGRRQRALKDRAKVVDLTARLVAQMDKESRQAGVDFVALAFPDKEGFAGETRWFHWLASSRRMRGVALVDMGLRFRREGLAFNDFAFDGIGHLNVRGHAVAARILEDVLAERGVIPKTAGS